MIPGLARRDGGAEATGRSTRIIVSITQVGDGLDGQVGRAAAAGADVVELRADLIHDPAAIRAVLENRPASAPPLLVTVRSVEEGGAWDGDEAARVALIESLGLLGPDIIDVEWGTWRRSANVRQKVGLVCRRADGLDESGGQRRKAELLLSRHDTAGTPAAPELDQVLDALCAEPAGVVKYVSSAQDALDALRVLNELQRRAAARPLVALAMGPAGLATRVLAAKFGAWGTFAALDAAAAAAPGQVAVDILRQRYRFDGVWRQTRVLGVIGWPVEHSRSPQLHNAALAADGIDAVYLPLAVRPTYAAFAAFMDFVAAADWLDASGFSVTIPHKEHALRWLLGRGAPLSDCARRCGAVNTLSLDADKGWRGDNTDGAGLLEALRAADVGGGAGSGGDGGQRRAALVLGAGGVARAAIVALQSAGWDVAVTNRTGARAEALGAELGARCVPWERRAEAVFELLVNATSVGMSPQVDATPMPDNALRRPGLVVADTVYTPAETRLLRAARAAGAKVVSGTQMFLAQADAQHRIWHGRAMPRTAAKAIE